MLGLPEQNSAFCAFSFFFSHSLGLNGTGCSPRWQFLAEITQSSFASLFLLGSPSVELAFIAVLGITLAGAIITTCMLFRRASLIRSYCSNIEKHFLHIYIHPGLSDFLSPQLLRDNGIHSSSAFSCTNSFQAVQGATMIKSK